MAPGGVVAALMASAALGFRERLSKTSGNDSFMVFFSKSATDATIDEYCRGVKCVNRGYPSQGGIPFAAVRNSGDVSVQSVKARSNQQVMFVTPDAEIDTSEEEELRSVLIQSSSGTTWGRERIGVKDAGATGRGVHVYVLDGGVRTSHEDFGGRAIPTLDATWLPPWECNGNKGCAMDRRGHGTHVAGSVGGAKFGVAVQSTIHAMNRGSDLSDAVAAKDWLIRNAIKPAVLQMSFGMKGFAESSRMSSALVVEAGITVVVASGNSNDDACGYIFGGFSHVISVAASDSDDTRAVFSNYGSCIDIFAPGVAIVSASYTSDTGEKESSGTSMAAPHVSGGIALLLENNPLMTPAEVKRTLQENAFEGELENLNTGDPNLLLKASA